MKNRKRKLIIGIIFCILLAWILKFRYSSFERVDTLPPDVKIYFDNYSSRNTKKGMKIHKIEHDINFDAFWKFKVTKGDKQYKFLDNLFPLYIDEEYFIFSTAPFGLECFFRFFLYSGLGINYSNVRIVNVNNFELIKKYKIPHLAKNCVLHDNYIYLQVETSTFWLANYDYYIRKKLD